MILDTKKHEISYGSSEYQQLCAIFLDGDLQILGTKPDIYNEYSKRIR